MSTYTGFSIQTIEKRNLMNKSITIFGREPAAWIGLIETLLVFVLTMFHFMSDAQLVLVMGAVTALFGAYVAFATADKSLAVIVGLAKTFIALGIGFGLHLTPELQAALLAVVYMTGSFFNRTQTTPLGSPVSPSPAQVVTVGSVLPAMVQSAVPVVPAVPVVEPPVSGMAN